MVRLAEYGCLIVLFMSTFGASSGGQGQVRSSTQDKGSVEKLVPFTGPTFQQLSQTVVRFSNSTGAQLICKVGANTKVRRK